MSIKRENHVFKVHFGFEMETQWRKKLEVVLEK